MSIQIKKRADYQSPAFTITDVILSVTLDPTRTVVTSKLVVQRQGQHQLPLVLNGEHLSLVELLLDGHPFTEYELDETSLTLAKVPDSFTLSITCHINPEENKALEGLYLSQGVYCTQCEAEGFRRITYFLDRPDVLAKYTVTLRGDKTSLPTLLANGNPVDRGEEEDGTHWITWHDPFPKPCYLFAMVAGDFDMLSDTFTTASGREVALQLYVDKGKADRGHFALESLKRAMEWDEKTYGLEYDLDIYMIVAVDFFNMGAMENKGLNIFNSKFVLADQQTATDEDFFNVESVIAHEYFHNWTGNRVTCRDWFQLSLKEGLTVFRDQQFSADMTSALSTRIKQVRVIREHQFAEDASAMSHPIRPEEVIEMNNFYTVTVYDKGAEVIRMLHTLLGAEGFRKGIDEYFRRHDGQAVTCDDFVAAMQDANDYDLSHFSLWYSQSGTPQITVNRSYNSHSRIQQITLSQHTGPTADQKDKQPLYMPVAIDCFTGNGKHVIDDKGLIENGQIILDKPEVTLTFRQTGEPVIPVVLGNFSAPAKVKNELSVEELLSVFSHARDPFNRWDALQQLYDECIEWYSTDNHSHVTDDIWNGLRNVIEKESDNHELLGECLVIPSFETLCQSRSQIDVQRLRKARDAFCHDFANQLQMSLLSAFQSIQIGSYQYSQQAVNARRFKNTLLHHLGRLPVGRDLVEEQFKHADNMTDTLGALRAAQHADTDLFDQMMQKFGAQWQREPLVLDKWFALHATSERSDILAHLTMLSEHPQFSIKNPNRVRALIGSFAFYNPAGFHAPDGSGYKYVTDYLLQLDQTNPQVAARIVTPLTQWQNYAFDYQEKMKIQLGRLLNAKSLSRDVFEKVSKSLAYGSRET